MTDHAPEPPTAPADFLKAALARIKSNLELFLGKTVEVSPAEPVEALGSEVAGRLPARRLVLGVKASGAVDAEIHCVVAQPLILAMAGHAKHHGDAQIAERLAGSPDLSDADRDGAREVASFITAALGDFAKESTGGRIVLAPMEPRFAARGDAPPWNPAEAGFAIETKVEVAGAPPSPLVVFVPSAVVAAWAEPEPASIFGTKVGRKAPMAAPAAAAPREASGAAAVTTWAAGTEDFVKSVQAAGAAALAVHPLPSLAEVIAAAGAGPGPALLVVFVASGAEFELDLIGALRRHPALAGTNVMVALEAPSHASIVRCGCLGLLDVIPADLDLAALAERLLAASRRKPVTKTR